MEEILRAENIIKSFGDKKVLDGVSLGLCKGEVLSLIGTSGVGKTTLFNIIAGLIKPDSGRVILKDEEITGENGHISYMLQKDLLLPHKSIIDNVSLPLVIGGMKKKDAREKAEEYFEIFGLKGEEKRYPAELSGGMRQRAALLRTYLMGNEVVLLDEPFSALDTITRGRMHEWYLSMQEKLSMSTIFITHDIDEAIMISDRVYLLKGTGDGTAEEFTIDEPRPRDPGFPLTESFLEYKKKLLTKLG